MSNHRNHRRNEYGRTEHGPGFESSNPGEGCNSTHIACLRHELRGALEEAEFCVHPDKRPNMGEYRDSMRQIAEQLHRALQLLEALSPVSGEEA